MFLLLGAELFHDIGIWVQFNVMGFYIYNNYKQWHDLLLITHVYIFIVVCLFNKLITWLLYIPSCGWQVTASPDRPRHRLQIQGPGQQCVTESVSSRQRHPSTGQWPDTHAPPVSTHFILLHTYYTHTTHIHYTPMSTHLRHPSTGQWPETHAPPVSTHFILVHIYYTHTTHILHTDEYTRTSS